MTKEKKYKIWLGVIYGVGTLLLLAIGAVWALASIGDFKSISELDKQKKQIDAEKETLKTTAQGLAAAKQALAEAQALELNLDKQLAFFRNRYRALDYRSWKPTETDPQNIALREVIWREQMREFSYDYGPRFMGELLGAAQASGVSLAGSDNLKIEVQDPPKGPENVNIPPNGFYKPIGDAPLPVEITGSLDQILAFFRNIHQGQILMKVGSSLKLSGSSPRITASFTVEPYLVAKGDNVVLTAVAAAPAGGAGGAGTASGSGSSSSPPGGSSSAGGPPTSTGTP